MPSKVVDEADLQHEDAEKIKFPDGGGHGKHVLACRYERYRRKFIVRLIVTLCFENYVRG